VPWKPDHWLADRLSVELERAGEDQIDLSARELASLGPPGWEKLVQGLQSKRPESQVAAERAIHEMVDSWKMLSPEDSAANVSALAQLLNERIPLGDEPSLLRFGDLAERLLSWPRGAGGVQFVYDCEQVLRAAQRVGWPKPTRNELAPNPPILSAQLAAPPSEPPRIDGPPPSVSEKEVDNVRTEIDSSAEEGTTAQELELETKPLGLQPVFSFVAPSQQQEQLLDVQEPPMDDSIETEPSVPASPDWRQLEIHEVLRHWRNPSFATAAEMELRYRRFDDRNLRIARVAADVDPEKRVQLVSRLPQMSGVNATSWLLILSRDESARVRGAAVQMLSTANDPRIRPLLQALEETETDKGVRAALRKGLAERRQE
jgi:hypothetical protein